jgi:hypothetical protein
MQAGQLFQFGLERNTQFGRKHILTVNDDVVFDIGRHLQQHQGVFLQIVGIDGHVAEHDGTWFRGNKKVEIAHFSSLQGVGYLIGGLDLIVLDLIGLLTVKPCLRLVDVLIGIIDYGEVLTENSSANKHCKKQNG